MKSQPQRRIGLTVAALLVLWASVGGASAAEALRGRLARLPDFMVTAVTLTPALPVNGQEVYATVTVLNRGGVPGDVGTVAVWAQSQALGRRLPPAAASVEFGSLEPGGSRTQTIGPFTAPTARGTHMLRVVADLNRKTRESSEQNNQGELRYEIRDPDLPAALSFTGTVVYKDFEGGFFAIDADDGGRYDPINLPAEYAIDGLRVWVSAQVCTDLYSCHMYGVLIRIVGIRLAEPAAPTYAVDFGVGVDGWEAGFADYPLAQEDAMELTADYRPRPDGAGNALYIAGNNHSDDLFMYLRRKLTLAPNTTYRVTFAAEFLSNVRPGLVGIGGAPGEGVTVKMGVMAAEPMAALADDGWYRMTIDKGNQSFGGADAVTIGHIANSGSDDWEAVRRSGPVRPFVVRTGATGELWLLVGTDSGFEGTTALYYTRLAFTLAERRAGAWVPAAQP